MKLQHKLFITKQFQKQQEDNSKTKHSQIKTQGKKNAFERSRKGLWEKLDVSVSSWLQPSPMSKVVL